MSGRKSTSKHVGSRAAGFAEEVRVVNIYFRKQPRLKINELSFLVQELKKQTRRIKPKEIGGNNKDGLKNE